MSLSEGIQIVQSFIALFAIVLGYRELQKWRHELIGKKRFEVALEAGKAAIRMKEAFKSARNPFGFKNDVEYKEESTEDEKRYQDKEFEFNRRLSKVYQALTNLLELGLDIELLFANNINQEIKIYEDKIHELKISMHNILDNQKGIKDIRTVYGYGSSDDPIHQEIEEVTNKILDFARKYTQ